jgi:hypothetical protein
MEGDVEPVLHEDAAARHVRLYRIPTAQQEGACEGVEAARVKFVVFVVRR